MSRLIDFLLSHNRSVVFAWNEAKNELERSASEKSIDVYDTKDPP